MTDLLIFLLGMCWGAFVVGLVVVLREGWKRGKAPWSNDVTFTDCWVNGP